MNILLIIINLFLSGPDMHKVRDLYVLSPASREKTEALLHEVEHYSEEIMVCKGYQGAAKMILAKHVFNPYKKIYFFKQGKDILEAAIAGDSLNIELRYLRLSIQQHAPFFLGYRSRITADREYLAKNVFRVQDDQLRILVTDVLNKSR